MSKLLTSAEYISQEHRTFPADAFSRFEAIGRVSLTPELREAMELATHSLVDGIERFDARPRVADAMRRLRQIISTLSKPIGADIEPWRNHLHALMEKDDVGDAVTSLLDVRFSGTGWLATLTAEHLEKARVELLSAAQTLRARLAIPYAGQVGPEKCVFLDKFIADLADIYKQAGGRPSAYWNEFEGHRQSRFVLLVTAVGQDALQYYAPHMKDGERYLLLQRFKATALEQRVREVLKPQTADNRRRRTRKWARAARKPR